MPSLKFILTLAAIFAAIKLIPIFSVWQSLLSYRMRYRHSRLADQDAPPVEFAGVFTMAAKVLGSQGFVFSHSIVRINPFTYNEEFCSVYTHPVMHAYAYVAPRQFYFNPFPYQITYVTHLSDGKTVWTTDWLADLELDLPPNQSLSDGFFGDTGAQWDLHQKSVEKFTSESWASPLALSPAKDVEVQSKLLDENVAFFKEKYFTEGDDGTLRYRPGPAWKLAPLFIKATKTRAARFGPSYDIPTESVEAHVEADVGILETELVLESKESRKGSQKLWLLLASAVAFAVVFGAFSSWESVPLILLVLLIHELGHWAGMKAFGYRDTRIYFIPFFGAITMGKNEDATPLQKLTVFLLGPLPGIVIGMAATCIYFITSQALWLKIGSMFLVINYLNLLPVSPLDGGRIIETLIQRRYPRAVMFLTLASGLVLCCSALLMGEPVLGILGVALLISLPRSRRLNKSIAALQATIGETREKHEILRKIVAFSYRPAAPRKNPDGRLGLVKPLYSHFTSPTPSKSHASTGFALYLVALASPFIFAVVAVIAIVAGQIAGVSVTSGNWEQRIADSRTPGSKLGIMLEAATWFEAQKVNPDSALKYYRRALTLADSADIKDYPYLQTLLGLSRVDRDSTRVREYLAGALSAAERAYGPNSSRVAEVLEQYGEVDTIIITDEDRIPNLERAIRIRSASNDFSRTSSLQCDLAQVFERRRQTARAESLYIQSVYSLEREKYFQAPAIHALASFHERMARPSHALSVLRTWESENRTWLHDNCMIRVELSSHRGWIAVRNKDTSLARVEFSSGLELMKREGLSSSYVIAPVAMDLCYLELSMGNRDSAMAVLMWVSERIPPAEMHRLFGSDAADGTSFSAEPVDDWRTVRHQAHKYAFSTLSSAKGGS